MSVVWMENAFWFKLNGHLVTDESGKNRLQILVVFSPPLTSTLSRKSPSIESSFPPTPQGISLPISPSVIVRQ